MHQPPVDLYKSPKLVLRFGGPYAAAKGNHTSLHQHEIWEIVYYRTGRPRSVLAGIGERLASPGLLWCTPPGQAHAEFADTAFTSYYLGIDAPVDIGWPYYCFDDADASISRLCQSILREASDTDPASLRLVALQLEELHLRIRRASQRAAVSATERILLRVELILEKRFSERIRLTDVATECGISASGLRAAFRSSRGESLGARLQSIRLRHALAHLAHSDLTLEAIADRCGYYSASHLSRHVKAQTGRAPGTLRLKTG